MIDLAIKLALASFVLFGVLNIAALHTWLERKQSAIIQDRIGANRASILGFRILVLCHPLADAVKMVRDLMVLVPQVLPITQTDVQIAIAIFEQYAPHGMRSRDAIHAAVMQHHSLIQIVSTDLHFDLIPGLTRLDPIALYQAASSPLS